MRLKMSHIALILQVLWLLTLCLQVGILLIMTGKKQYRNFLAIYLYILIGLAESPLLLVVYEIKGFESPASYWTAWISQGVVVLARWIAVCALCRTILGQFRGVWALTWRALALIGTVALLVAVMFGGHDYARRINTFDLGLEFSIATVLVGFFAFTRFYDIPVLPAHRSIGVAFCLYSCFRAFNDTVLQTFLGNYAGTWSIVDGVTYLATLTLIGSAVYVLGSQRARPVNLLPAETYAEFMPQANARLMALNERLRHLLKPQSGGKS
jgi:hypothetical protein